MADQSSDNTPEEMDSSGDEFVPNSQSSETEEEEYPSVSKATSDQGHPVGDDEPEHMGGTKPLSGIKIVQKTISSTEMIFKKVKIERDEVKWVYTSLVCHISTKKIVEMSATEEENEQIIQ